MQAAKTVEQSEEGKDEIQKLLEMYTNLSLARVSSEDLEPGNLYFLLSDPLRRHGIVSLHIVTKREDSGFIESKAILGMRLDYNVRGSFLSLEKIEFPFEGSFHGYFGKSAQGRAYKLPIKVLAKPSEVVYEKEVVFEK